VLSSIALVWSVLTAERKKQVCVFSLGLILAGVLELLTLGAVVPFLGMVVDPDWMLRLLDEELGFRLRGAQDLVSNTSLLLGFSALLCVVVILAGVCKFLVARSMAKLAYSIGNDLSVDVFRTNLNQSLESFSRAGSDDLIATVLSKVNLLAFQAVLPVFQLISGLATGAMILLALGVLDPWMAGLTVLAVGLSYGLTVILVRARLEQVSVVVSLKTPMLVSLLRESMAGYREVKVYDRQESLISDFAECDSLIRQAQAESLVLGGAPKYLLETIGILIVVVIGLWLELVSESGRGNSIVYLGVIAMAGQRLLPLGQNIYSAYVSLRSSRRLIQDVCWAIQEQPHEDFRTTRPPRDDKGVGFESWSCEHACLRIDSNVLLFEDFSWSFSRGDQIAIVGPSGSGKSSLLDLILRFRDVQSGQILVNSKGVDQGSLLSDSFRVGFAAQRGFLMNKTILENIVFAQKAHDRDRLVLSARIAGLEKVVKRLPEGMETRIGDDGKLLSGGERQRVVLARAIYWARDMLILDEATCSLDRFSEAEVVEKLTSELPDLTIIYVTHNLDLAERYFSKHLAIEDLRECKNAKS